MTKIVLMLAAPLIVWGGILLLSENDTSSHETESPLALTENLVSIIPLTNTEVEPCTIGNVRRAMQSGHYFSVFPRICALNPP